MARSARASSGAVDLTLLALCVVTSFVVVFLPGELRDRAAATLRRSVVSPLAELQGWAEERRAAFVSYDERTRARGEEVRAVTDVRALRSENAHLRALLGLGARLEWGFVTAEAIPSQTPSELVRTPILLSFRVTAGSDAGVVPFTPVASAQGLVGMVRQSDRTGSVAITYSHSDFRASAMTPDSMAFGIAQPHLGSGEERGLLEIRGVPFRSPLRAGQLIVTSGLGATYPRGVPIGTVIREIQTPEKWARTYLLQPTASLSDVGPVLLLLRRRAVAGVDGVWASVPAADSAARAVAAAGDSLARAAALREMAARRAALDSALADSLRRDTTARPLVVPAPGGAQPSGLPGAAPGASTPAPTPARPPAVVPPRTVPTPGAAAALPRPARRDTARRDTARRDTTRREAAPIRADSARRPVPDTTAPPRPTVPPPAAGAAPSAGAGPSAGARPAGERAGR